MAFLKRLIPYSILFFSLTSCAKFGYLMEQGVGQIKLMMNARPNEKVLTDPKISSADKEKIKKIQIYKDYFYTFWSKEKSNIYSETTILEDQAVTYLVIISPHDKIKAREECFPFMGCFPYIGFFNKSSAQEYLEKMEKDGLISYLRPVYAYSTLGYLEDKILSSFFQYNDYDLAELIFHELFHTIFFAKDEVPLNENLASYFSKEMTINYFQESEEKKRERKRHRENGKALNFKIVELAHSLNKIYKSKEKLSHKKANQILEKFLNEIFIPFFKQKCHELKISQKKCFPLNREWNNASLAALLTYESEADHLDTLRGRLKLSLKEFFVYIEKKYDKYDSSNKENGFSKFLFSQ